MNSLRFYNTPQGFSAWFNDMSQIFNATELAHIAVSFLDSVQVSEKASPVSTLLMNVTLLTPLPDAEKLIVIHYLVRGPLFTAEEPRSVLLPALLKHVKTLLDRLNPEVWVPFYTWNLICPPRIGE